MGSVERVALTYIHYHVLNRELGEAAVAREVSSVLRDNLEGWDGGVVGGRLKTEGINIYTLTADSHEHNIVKQLSSN